MFRKLRGNELVKRNKEGKISPVQWFKYKSKRVQAGKEVTVQIKNELQLHIFLFFASSMRSRPGIKRVIAMFLLLVFFQQMGAGLFVHNLLHDKTPVAQSPVQKNEGVKEISFSCNCIDNFLMPFVAVDEPLALQRVNEHTKPVDSFSEKTYFTTLIFSSLRGPPVL